MKIAYMGLVRNTLGISEEEVELPPGSRVSDLLSLLGQKHGDDFRYTIFTNTGQLRPLVKIFIGERTIDDMEGLDTEIESGSGVYILLLDHSLGGG